MTSSNFSMTPKTHWENPKIFDNFTTLASTLSEERRVKKLEETVATLSTLFHHHPQIFKNPHVLKNVTSLASSFKHELMNNHELSSKQEDQFYNKIAVLVNDVVIDSYPPLLETDDWKPVIDYGFIENNPDFLPQLLAKWQSSTKKLDEIIERFPQPLREAIVKKLDLDSGRFLDTIDYTTLQNVLKEPNVSYLCVKDLSSCVQDPFLKELISHSAIPIIDANFLSWRKEYPMVVNETGKEEHAITLSHDLVAKSRQLSHLQIQAYQKRVSKEIAIKLASSCDLDILNKINTSNYLNQFEINDIEFCYKILDIANWLEIAPLYSRIDIFLGETYLPRLKESSLSITKTDPKNKESSKGLRLANGSLVVSEELADTLYFYNLSKVIPEDLPKTYEASSQKIQQWLQLSANDNASVVKKCQQLAEMGVYLDSLDLSFAGTLKDEDVNAIIESQPHLKKLHLSSSEIKGNINLKNLKKLTILNMTGCRLLTNDFGIHLQGLPLNSLNMTGCHSLTDDFGIHLQGLPLNSLDMTHCFGLTDAFGIHIQGLFLNSLTMEGCNLLTDDFGIHLQEFPLTSLNMGWCNLLTNDFGIYLQRFPLTSLNMAGCRLLTNDFGIHLQRFPLTSLNMRGCHLLTDDFGAYLHGLPLNSLNMGGCDLLTDDFGIHLRRLPLNTLNMGWCKLLTDDFGIHLRELPLRSLDMKECRLLTDAFYAHLQRVPFT